MPQSKPLNPVFPIFLTPFSYNILQKDQDKGQEEVRSDPLRRDQVFRNKFYENLWAWGETMTFTGKEGERQLD